MIVVHVVTLVSDTGAFGGPTTVALQQVRALNERGHEALLMGMRDTPSNRALIEGVPVTLFRAHTLLPGVGFSGVFNVRLLPALYRATGRADIVHVHAGRDLVSLSALAMARLRRTPYVTQTHGMVMPRSGAAQRTFDALLRPLMRSARRRFVLTTAEEEGLARVVPGVDFERLTNGVLSTSTHVPRSLSPVPVVTFLARLHPRKRVLAFVDACELVAHGHDVRCLVYGPDDGEASQLRARIRDGAPVEYLGALSHADAVHALGAADVYVLPSVDEPFPMSVLEAIVQGTPSVIVHSCGLADILADTPGIAITDGTAQQLADAVCELIDDPDRWRECSAFAQTAAQQLFSMSAVVEQLVKAYS